MLKNHDAASAAVAFSPACLPPPDLCVKCGSRPRAAAGKLSRCLQCVKADAEVNRLEREAVQRANAPGPSKRCKTCRRERGIDHFARNKNARDGMRRDCKTCVAAGKVKPQTLSDEQKARDRERRAQPHRRAVHLASVLKWQLENRTALDAHRKVATALANGSLTKPAKCEIKGCSNAASHGHHNNYKHELKLVWICRAHHKALHEGRRFKTKSGCAYKSAYEPRTARAPKTK